MKQPSLPTRNSGLRVFSASLLSALLIMMPFVQLAVAEKRLVATSQRSQLRGAEDGTQQFQTKSASSAAEDLFVNPPVLAGPITATKRDSYTNAPGPAAPGDTITYTVDVTNTGGTDAASVAFSDTIDPNTTLVGGSLKVSPLAIADTYSATKNTPLVVGLPGVLANDTGLPAPTAVAIAGGPTTQGGTVTLNTDGSFTYTPPNATFTGADTFTYSVTNTQAPLNPSDAQGTVTINVDAIPEVTATTPVNNATDQASDTNITVTFSEPVNVTGAWFTISCTVSGAHTAAVSGGPTTYTLNPNTDFTEAETCTVTIVAAQVTDVDTNDPPDNMAADYIFSFSIDAAPSVTSTAPTNGATGIATNSNITVNFSESVSLGGSPVTISCATSGSHASAVSGSPNTTFTVNPTVDFVPGELCTVTVLAAQVSDTDANDPPNNMVANYVFSFTTDAAPSVTATTPTNGATNQTTNTDITLTFSESVSLTAAPVTISCTVTGAHNTYTVSASPNTVFTINPSVDFGANETCTVTVLANQVSDTDSGDPPDNMTANFVFSFSTDAAPAVTTVTPTNGSTQVASNTNIVVNFSEPVNIVDATAFIVECPTGSPVAFSVTPAAPGASSSFTINPTSDLPFNTICTVTVDASKVTDTDANDPPDNMAANFMFSFTVDAVPTVTTTTPANSSLSNLKTTNVTINFSENVGVTAGGVTINCGAGNVGFSGLPATNVNQIVLDPTNPLPAGSTCTVTVLSANTTDSDAGDPPNNLDGDNNGSEGGDYVFTFGVAPDAVNDAYNATGNVGIVIPVNGVLANDVGPGAVVDRVGTASANTVVPATVPTSSGGSVTMNADGSFTYLPPTGQATGTDTFKYRISNAGGVSTDATVTITITGIVWFICDGCGGGNQGTLQNPYTSVFAFSDKNGDGAGFPAINQRIFIRSGTYDLSNDNLTLLNGQIVSGQGQSATSFFPPEPNSPAAYAALTAGTRPVIAPTGSGGNAVNLASGNSLTQLNLGSDISGTCAAGSSPANGTLLNAAAGVGALAISNMIVNGCGRATNIPSGGTVGVVFDSVSSRNSSAEGIVWNGNTGGSVSFGPVTINNSTGVGVSLASNTATFTFGNANVSGSGGTGVSLGGAGTGNSGTITFADLDISPDSGQRGIQAQQNSGAITTTSGDIVTTSGVAVSISGTSSANKTPLNVQLTKVSATNATTGISLTNTSTSGSPGGFRVLGTGGSCSTSANCTGGAITGSGSTTNGILLSGASDVSFVRMFIQNTTDSGVRGSSGVTNFSFTNGVIDNSGTSLGADTSNLAFNTQASGTETNLSGVVTISNNTLTNPYYHGIDLYNFGGTISSLTVQTNVITSTTSTATSKGTGIRVVAFGSASTVAHVNDATISGNTISNFPSGAGITIQGGNASSSGATQGTMGIPNDASNLIDITGNTIKGQNSGNKMGTNAIQTSVNGVGRMNVNIQNNGTIANPITNIAGNVISVSVLGNSTGTAVIDNNVIVANHQANFGGPIGISAGVGKTFGTSDVESITLTITNNNVSQTDGNGIKVRGAEAQGTLNVSIKNNTVGAPLSPDVTTYGIRLESAGTTGSPLPDNDFCVDIQNNTTLGSTDGFDTAPGIGLRKQGTSTTANAFGVEGMAATSSPGVQQYVGNAPGGKNPASGNGTAGGGGTNGVILISATSGFTNCSSAPLLLASGGVMPYDAGLFTTKLDQLMTLSNARGATKASDSISDSLTQPELDLVVSAAIERWSRTGLTAQQITTLRSIKFDIAELDGSYLGKAVGNHIAIDRNAGGKGWYVGSDSLTDALFAHASSTTRRYTDPMSTPAGHLDLLTAIEHEMGHKLGLVDSYLEKDRDSIMYGYLTVGERRAPAKNQAMNAQSGSLTTSHFLTLKAKEVRVKKSEVRRNHAKSASALSAPMSGEPVNHTIGTLPATKAVRITFQVVVDTPFLGPDQVENQGSITHSLAGSPVLTDDPDTGPADDKTVTLVAGPPVANDDNYSSFKNQVLNVPAPGVLSNDTGAPTVSAVGGCSDVTDPFTGCATTAGGTVTVGAGGSFTYTPPNPTFTGPDSFTYTATNAVSSDTATVNITVVDTSAIYINEVLFNPTGTDAPNEYIELRGPASSTIPAGTYLVAIEGDGAENPGDVRTIINLGLLQFGSNGFLVLLQNGNSYTTDAGATVVTSTTTGFGGLPGSRWSADSAATDLPDASTSFLLIQTGTVPTLTDDIDSNDDGTADGTVFTGWSVRDSIGALDGGASDVGYGALTYALGGGGIVSSPNTMAVVGFAAVYVGRICDSTGSTSTDWAATGALGGTAPNWTLGSNPEPPSFAGNPLDHIGSTNFINSAPVNTVPAAQATNEDTPFIFTGPAQISIADSDAGSNPVQVTLTATNGTMTLGGTGGLTFTPPGAGNDGTDDTTMVFTGTVTDINTALNNLTFTPTSNFSGSASVQIQTNDQGNTGGAACSTAQSATNTVIITVGSANDAPVLDNTGNMSLTGIPQDVPDASNPGTLVSAIIASAGGDRITDPDAGAVEGIAVIAVDNTNGTWQYTTDGGGIWTAFGSPTGTSARLLAADGLTRIRFKPNVGFSGTVDPGITFRAWDQTSGSNGGTADASLNGGATAFSTATETASISVSSSVSVHDATQVEPSSGSINMVFTVTLEAPAAGTVNVNFTTADEPAGPGKAVAGVDYTATNGTVTFTAGQQVQSILVPILSNAPVEGSETFLVNLTGATGANIADNQAIGTITEGNVAGTLIISEFRSDGPGGSSDDFVEVYNNTDSDHTVDSADDTGYGIFARGADCDDTPVLVGFISEGTVIKARHHYLLVGTQYSLKDYGGTNAAIQDAELGTDIPLDSNVGLFKTANIAALSSVLRLDAVGVGLNTGGNCDLLREGSPPLPAVGALGATTQYSYFRKLCDFVGGCTTPGTPKDTNDNSTDFMLADTLGTNFGGANQRLGAPGPENHDSPLKRDAGIPVLILDSSKAPQAIPNRDRDFTDDMPGVTTHGSLYVRRRVVNNTGGNVTRLRFRVVEMTTFVVPGPPGQADLRALDSITVSGLTVNDPATCAATGTPTTNPCSVSVQGLTLEQPPTQTIGGGTNATLAVGTITTGSPLLPGASANVQFRLGIRTPGVFRFLIIVEALP